MNYTNKLTDSDLSYLSSLTDEQLNYELDQANRAVIICDTNQLNRKILINSMYGALGNANCRYYDIRNASAITTFGRLAIQWIERKINEFLNKICSSDGIDYIIAIDTDSVYINVEALINKVGLHKFKDQTSLVDFLDKFASQKLEPFIKESYIELSVYMNNRENLMNMDREAIATKPFNSDGVGSIWTAKKRYALNLYDMEGVRYEVPKLKIMGLETKRSGTPRSVQVALEECIRLMLQEGESALQTYYKEYELNHQNFNYKEVAVVSSANNVAKYNDNGYPGSKCPYHIRGVLTYNRATSDIQGAEPILEGNKVMVVPLKDGNTFKDKCISWPSGTDIDISIRDEVLKYIDYATLLNKTFKKPLSVIADAAKLEVEKKANLKFLFG